MALATAKAAETTNTLITADNKYIQNISSSQIFSSGLRNQHLLSETLPKALQTQALTALASNFGLVGLVQYAW